MNRFELLHGDCLEKIKGLEDTSIDAVVTDPPYELGFMGKKWDASGIAYNVGLWREVLRVLKPGGHLLAFGGTRTYHRMAVAIEDAGFEIRDSIHWIYGSGFPKSLDVSKAIDKAAGARGHEGRNMRTDDGIGTASYRATVDPRDYVRPPPATDDARTWLGWGTALKPSHEPIVVARKPLDGTVAANVLAHGTGALNVDGCRVKWNGPEDAAAAAAAASFASGRANGTHKQSVSIGKESRDGTNTYHPDKLAGRWPSNAVFSHLPECGDTCAEGCAVAELDGQSEDVSRFFPAFRYQAKPARSEREAGLREAGLAAIHPTVKPVELMRWLVRLVTPPGGVVLDPFTGSGTTGVACMLEGFRFMGCEREAEYLAIAKARIEHALRSETLKQPGLFDL